VTDGSAIEPSARNCFHRGDEIAGKPFHVGHCESLVRRNDEAEVKAVVARSPLSSI
jgi:hypothetical protein